MGLSISTTDIKLDMESTPSRLEIQSRRAKIEIRQNNAKLDIKSDPPCVIIDQYQCFAEAGLKNNFDLLKEASTRTYQHIMDHIGQTAADGGRLAAIEKGGSPIAEVARRDSFPTHEFGLDFIPKSRPKIDVTGSLQVEPVLDSNGATNSVSGEFTPGSLEINYTPGKVIITVRQYPSIAVKYEGNTIDTRI